MVEPDYKVHVAAGWKRGDPPNDPNLGLEWHLPKISAEGAWAQTTGSAEIKVRGGAAAGQALHRGSLRAGAVPGRLPPPPPAPANFSPPPARLRAPLPARQVCHVDSGVRVDHPDLAANVLKGWNFVPAGQVRRLGRGGLPAAVLPLSCRAAAAAAGWRSCLAQGWHHTPPLRLWACMLPHAARGAAGRRR